MARKNALYAASCGLNAINAIRETFMEKDISRVHPIITSGGSMVNAIPEKAVLESYVRGSSFDAIVKVNKKVNRALIGAALSIGTNIEIIDSPGYAPLINDKNLIELAKKAANLSIPEREFTIWDEMSSGSTDMGDLCCVMPVVHPLAGGAKGTSHGDDYEIEDPIASCVDSAKMQLALLYLLLEDDAKEAKRVIKEYKPLFKTKEEFLSYVDNLKSSGDRIDYSDESSVKVRL